MNNLDKWDIAFIKLTKGSEPVTMKAVCELWAKRVGMSINPVSFPGHVSEYLANLIDRLDLTPDLFKVIVDMAPHRGWYYNIPEAADYTERSIFVMMGWLRHTEVVRLPGYREAIEAEDRLHAALDRDDALNPETENGA